MQLAVLHFASVHSSPYRLREETGSGGETERGGGQKLITTPQLSVFEQQRHLHEHPIDATRRHRPFASATLQADV